MSPVARAVLAMLAVAVAIVAPHVAGDDDEQRVDPDVDCRRPTPPGEERRPHVAIALKLGEGRELVRAPGLRIVLGKVRRDVHHRKAAPEAPPFRAGRRRTAGLPL